MDKWVDEQIGLKHCGFSKEIYIQTIHNVIKQVPGRMEHISECIKRNDYESYIIEAHTLKSNAALIGAETIAQEAKELEYAGKEKKYDYIHNNTEQFLNHMEELIEELKKKTSGELTGKEDMQCMPYIEECFNCLGIGELEFAKEALEIIGIYECSQRFSQIIEEIKQNINRGEVRQAKLKLQQILQEE